MWAPPYMPLHAPENVRLRRQTHKKSTIQTINLLGFNEVNDDPTLFRTPKVRAYQTKTVDCDSTVDNDKLCYVVYDRLWKPFLAFPFKS